jgi:CheY-like chemotaxis protein
MNNKVMIVDDEPDVLESLRTVLEKANYEVVTVESGEDCLKKLEQGFKGIILMDIMMPGMNGFDTIKEIVNRGYINDVAIDIVTGMGIKDAQSLGVMEPYIHDYLEKPVDIKVLINSVEKCNMFLDAKKRK